MLLLKFNLDDIEKCKSFEDVFEMLGIGLREKSKKDLNIRNKEVFGPKANYQNMFINPTTDNRIYKQLKQLGNPKKNTFSKESFTWTNYGPISNGPRYDKVKEIAGDIVENVLYILTPDDDLYVEAPRLD